MPVFAAPAVSCAKDGENCAHEHTGTVGAFGIPCAMVLRLMLRSPRRRIPFASVIGELTVLRARSGSQRLRRFDASHGRQDHTVLPYASVPLVCRAAIAHRPKPALRSSSATGAAASTAFPAQRP